MESVIDLFDEDSNNEFDETAYLMASEANRKSLDESILQIEQGDRIRVTLDDIYKNYNA